MTKYVECWGADKPFANITDSKMAKNIGLAVSWSLTVLFPLNEFDLFLFSFPNYVEHCNDRIEFTTGRKLLQ